jgi:hypothetical protein
MKRIYYGEANFLVGDEAGDALVEFAVLVAKRSSADLVKLAVLGPDGNEETASFVLGPGTTVLVETTRSQLAEPDNTAALASLRERMGEMSATALPVDADILPPRSHLED